MVMESPGKLENAREKVVESHGTSSIILYAPCNTLSLVLLSSLLLL